MATSFAVIVAPRAMKNKNPVIVRGVDIPPDGVTAIFTAVYLASLLLAVVNTTEEVLGWFLASLWLFLGTALIYTPDLVRIELVVWSSLAAHLLLQLSHSAVHGDAPWITATVAFLNAFAVLIGSAIFAIGGLALSIAQSSLETASALHHISLAFATLPIFHVLYSRWKDLRN